MPRYRLTIAYDGTDFHGWQRQDVPEEQVRARSGGSGGGPRVASVSPALPPDVVGSIEPGRVALRTVQHVVEQAVREAVREPVDLVGASRTDTGVHARAQCASFAASEARRGAPDERMLEAINSRLDDDVVVTACQRTRDDFDPIADCVSKGYRYTISDGRARPLWDRRYVANLWTELDVAPMRQAAATLVGEHDFGAFTNAGHGRESTVRTVLSCEVSAFDVPGPDGTAQRRIAIDVSGTGFLYNMVRIIAGTLVEVGRGRMTTEDVQRALADADRRLAGPTMAPEGLCLMWIRYPEDG